MEEGAGLNSMVNLPPEPKGQKLAFICGTGEAVSTENVNYDTLKVRQSNHTGWQ